MSENKKSLMEAVESKGAGIVIPMLNPKDLQVKISAVVPPAYADAIECDKRWSERFKKQCAEVVDQHKDVLDFEDKDRIEGNKPVVAEKPVKVKDQKLTEGTHAAVAKPAGDKVKAYNNALRYAKKYGVPYCYGYTNSRLAGKFFAFDQPFKWDGDDKAFRAQYKNALTIYIAYPDKAFIKESLNRSLTINHDEIGDLDFHAKDESLKEGYLDNLKNLDYWQHQVDYQLEKFGRVGGGLIQDLDENGFYLNADNKVVKKLHEGTVKNSRGKWVNKGEEGTHGEFDTKKEADAQRKAMYANGYKESLTEDVEEESSTEEEELGEPEAEVKINLEKFKPWGKAVDTYSQIQEAGKMEDFERVLEEGWPDGIKDQTLNELLVEDKDWLAEVLDMEFIDKRMK